MVWSPLAGVCVSLSRSVHHAPDFKRLFEFCQSISPDEYGMHHKRKNRFSIRLSNGEVIGITGDVLLSNQVRVGDLLDHHSIEKLIELECLNEVRESALSLISYRMRSKKEIVLRLHRKGFTTIQIESTIAELEK